MCNIQHCINFLCYKFLSENQLRFSASTYSQGVTHSLNLSQSKLNTSEKSALAPLGTRSWTGHMRATRVFLWRRYRAGSWLTHGWDHPDGGLQRLVIQTEFQLGIHANRVRSWPILLAQLLTISDSLGTFPLPAVCASFETAIEQEFIFRWIVACPEFVTALGSSAEKCLKTFTIIMIIITVIAAHSQESNRNFSHSNPW